MTASEVSICNDALDFLGIPSIVSFDENTQAARTCKRSYEPARNRYLGSHPWGFATRFAALAEIDPAGLYNAYSYAYSYPARCLRTLSVRFEDTKRHSAFALGSYRELGADSKVITTDANPAYAECIMRVDDPLQFTSSFAGALAQNLAFRMAMPLTRNLKIRKSAFEYFLLLDASAKEADASADMPEEPPLTWDESRRVTGGVVWQN